LNLIAEDRRELIDTLAPDAVEAWPPYFVVGLTRYDRLPSDMPSGGLRIRPVENNNKAEYREAHGFRTRRWQKSPGRAFLSSTDSI
jgi:hypothetical protein